RDGLATRRERSESNSGGAAEGGVTITSPPLPDLRVANVTVDEASGGTLQSGGPMTIHWQTRNDGAAAVTAAFHERLVVSNGGQTLLNTNLPYDGTGAGSIAVGGSVARSFTFNLPDGAPGAGTITVSVTTDSNNEVVE